MKDVFFDFRAKRGFGDAAWFYVFYVFWTTILSFAIHIFEERMFGRQPMNTTAAAWLGAGTVTGIMMVLSFKVLLAKGLARSKKHIAFALLPFFCGLIGGTLLGILPIAYLTTVPPRESEEVVDS